ncbi:MATE family efflux transporter [uncultured Limosilactobacillus sp.]|uniref:MATE family efflux transporter n=1 Tax=uncultured Limosilactobacillus sp. TaxID=2837629 RepID=UPI0025CF4A20|nr:MATE family efflux transporter [uncultured Limosilactobacillus sp.]
MDELFSKVPVKTAYFKLALPVVMGMITTMIYNLADTMFVAKTGRPDLVAGVTIGAPLFTFLLAVADIFGLGGSSVVSRLLGEQRHGLAKRVSSFCLYGSIITGIVLTGLLLLLEHPILHLLGAKPATYEQAAAFYRVLSFGAVFIIFSIVPQNLIRTEGLASQAMIATVAGTVLAIILDPIFLFVLRWGTAGVALANVIGYFFCDLLLIWMVTKKAHYVTLNVHQARIHKREIGEVIAIGIPGSITNFALTFGMALLNSSLAAYGASMVAAMGITQKIYGVVILVIVGFAFGAQPLIGFNYGAKQWQRLHEILRFDFLVEVTYAVIVGGLLIIFSRPVAALFMNQPVIVHAASYMLIATLVTTPLVGLILVYTTVFQSMGNARGAFIMSVSRQGIIYWVALEALKHSFGYNGIVWAQAASDVLTCVLGYWLYRVSLDWKDKLPRR